MHNFEYFKDDKSKKEGESILSKTDMSKTQDGFSLSKNEGDIFLERSGIKIEMIKEKIEKILLDMESKQQVLDDIKNKTREKNELNKKNLAFHISNDGSYEGITKTEQELDSLNIELRDLCERVKKENISPQEILKLDVLYKAYNESYDKVSKLWRPTNPSLN